MTGSCETQDGVLSSTGFGSSVFDKLASQSGAGSSDFVGSAEVILGSQDGASTSVVFGVSTDDLGLSQDGNSCDGSETSWVGSSA